MLFLGIVSCCRLLRLSLASLFTEETYHQKNNIVPVRRYNRLIKILDKPPNGGHVVTTLLQQLKYILSIQADLDDLFASLYNVPSTLMCLKTSRKKHINLCQISQFFHRYVRTITSSLNKHSSLPGDVWADRFHCIY